MRGEFDLERRDEASLNEMVGGRGKESAETAMLSWDASDGIALCRWAEESDCER